MFFKLWIFFAISVLTADRQILEFSSTDDDPPYSIRSNSAKLITSDTRTSALIRVFNRVTPSLIYLLTYLPTERVCLRKMFNMHHPSSLPPSPSSLELCIHLLILFLYQRAFNCLSVTKVTLQPPMSVRTSVCQSVTKTP